MTDVPALAATFLCLAVGGIAVRRRPVSMGLLGQRLTPSGSSPSASASSPSPPQSASCWRHLCAEPRRRGTWASAVVLAAGCAGLYLWERGLPGQFGDVPDYAGGASRIILSLTSATLVLAPAGFRRGSPLAASLAGHRTWRSARRSACSSSAFASSNGFPACPPRQCCSTISCHRGAPPDGMSSREAARSFSPMPLCTDRRAGHGRAGGSPWLGSLCGRLAPAFDELSRVTEPVAGGASGRAPGLLCVYTTIRDAGLIQSASGTRLFDRYLWPLVPVLATLLLYVPADLRGRRAGRTARTGAGGGGRAPRRSWWAAMLAATGRWPTCSTRTHSMPADGGRGKRSSAWGFRPPRSMPDMSGSATMPRPSPSAPRPSTGPTSYLDLWPAFRGCGLVSADPRPPAGAERVGSIEYRLLLVAGPLETLYLYRLSGDGCPAGGG